MSFETLHEDVRAAQICRTAIDEGTATRRQKRDYDLLVLKITDTMMPLIYVHIRRKNFRHEHMDEVRQHVMIAINRVIPEWDEAQSAFHTFATWRVRDELQKIELKLFPERRRLKLDVIPTFRSLDLETSVDEEGEHSILSVVAGDTADNVEADLCAYSALYRLDRCFSHHFAAKERAQFREKARTEEKVREFRIRMMRQRDMWIRKRLSLETLEAIGEHFGVTRERVRQVIEKLEEMMDGYLPVIDRKQKINGEPAVLSARREPPAGFNELWLAYASAYAEHTGSDPRLVERHIPLNEVLCDPVLTDEEGEHAEQAEDAMTPAPVEVLCEPALISEEAGHAEDALMPSPSEVPVTVEVIGTQLSFPIDTPRRSRRSDAFQSVPAGYRNATARRFRVVQRPPTIAANG